MSGATFSRVKVWVHEFLKYPDLNVEFNNILTNFTPAGMDDQSSNVATMQATVDPYPGASPSLPTDLAGELQRIRYMLAQITGETYWYVDPGGTLKSVPLAAACSGNAATATSAYGIETESWSIRSDANVMIFSRGATIVATLNLAGNFMVKGDITMNGGWG
jgi:hypothetical protein